MLEHPSFRPKVSSTHWSSTMSNINVIQIFRTGTCALAGEEDAFPGPDNPSKMRRSVENAEHVGQWILPQKLRLEQTLK